MNEYVILQGHLSDPRHIVLNMPAPLPAGEVEVLLRSRAQSEPFWKERSLEELSTEQGIRIPQDIHRLLGQGADFWDDDREFLAFLNDLQASAGTPQESSPA